MTLFDNIIYETMAFLENKGTILYPTDTVWGIGCDATCYQAVQKIFNIKKRDEKKSLILLVSDVEMLQKYLNVIAQNNTVAIRIVKNHFCQKLIRKFGKPIVSTSANISGESTPHFFKEIDDNIKNAVDFIVPLEQEKMDYTPPSQLVKIENEEFIFLRK